MLDSLRMPPASLNYRASAAIGYNGQKHDSKLNLSTTNARSILTGAKMGLTRKLSTGITLLVIFGLSACGSSWQTINGPQNQYSFQLPKPVESMERGPMLQYVAKHGKTEFRVGVIPRDAASEQAAGIPDDQTALTNFMQEILQGLQQNLIKSGYQPQFEDNGAIQVSGGMAQQYTVTVGDQTILNRFYVTPTSYYYIKIDNGVESDQTVAKFLSSFQAS